MTVTIPKCTACGTVTAPPSKSMAHRLLMCAGLCRGRSVIRNVAFSEDILATLDCLCALGAHIETEGSTVTVTGTDPFTHGDALTVCCRESGSTLRFFLPVFLLSGRRVTLCGRGRLMQRPQGVYEALCRERGLLFSQTEEVITVQGPLTAGEFTLPGDISSQFVSGLLFALPLLPQDSTLHILPPVESRAYIDLTLQAMNDFGIEIGWQDDHTLVIRGRQQYRPASLAVEGDHSNAAFWEALNSFGSAVTVTGLRPDSLQGDRVYGVYYAALARGEAVDISGCPDLGPVLMAVAAALGGGTITGTRRLALKESDRGAAMAEELKKLGVGCTAEENRITVGGGVQPPTEMLCGHNDHRIVMALSVLLTTVGGSIQGAEAVSKSYPDFFDQMKTLGIGSVCTDDPH